MSEYKRGDERIMRVCDIDCGLVSWACEGEVVRCRDCVNWGTAWNASDWVPSDYCPAVGKCTRPGDWCCWGAKGEREEVPDEL